jgi:excinuclease ABC subunit A
MIEHNLDVLLQADHLIDLGPEGGDRGGAIVKTGTPEAVAACPQSYTGIYLKELLERKRPGRSSPARKSGNHELSERRS